MSITVIGSVENGAYVARVPSHGFEVRVPLRPIGTRIGGVEIGAYCARMGTPEISGKWWNKAKRKAKRYVNKTLSVAKKIADTKIVKTLYASAKQAMPTPYKEALIAVETGVRFGVAIAKGSKKAKKALPIVKALAKGKISLEAAKRAAPLIGIKPETIRDAAATIKLKEKAKTHPKLRKLFDGVAQIEALRAPPASKRANEQIVTARSGNRYVVSIRRAA